MYSQFVQEVQDDRIRKVDIASNERTVKFERADGSTGTTTAPVRDKDLITDLINHKVEIKQAPPDTGVSFWSLVLNFLPVLLIIGFWLFMMRQMQGGGGGARARCSFGKSRAKLLNEDQSQGHLRRRRRLRRGQGRSLANWSTSCAIPGRFQKLGGKIPRGVLMVGPPGTGKTLLARAIAGEAKVPFFSISGSDFVEMFVGVGASRVRDMFEQAKKHAPCIIFIDEIDAVGRHRGAGLGGGHDEREQTLNQMLVEMDGFEGGEGVIVIAATNRPDVLDTALLRPGRFDRQVMVGLPDIKGREQILKVHMRKVPLHDNVRPDVLARGTPGFSGADLANLVNEAALFAARRNKNQVDMLDFEDAKDKIFMGPERRSMVIREEERRKTAYHESGHAVVAMSLPGADPVHKVTIMPRGWALGVTWQLPEHDEFSKYTRQDAGGDCRSCSAVASPRSCSSARCPPAPPTTSSVRPSWRVRMVTKYGMSDALGTMVYADDKDSGFGLQNKTISEATQQKVDCRDPPDPGRAVRRRARHPGDQARYRRSDDRRPAGVGDHRRRPGPGDHAGPPAFATAGLGGQAGRRKRQGRFVHAERAGDRRSRATDLSVSSPRRTG